MPDRAVQLSVDCPICGQQIPTGVRFCLDCGSAVNTPDKSSIKSIDQTCQTCKSADPFNVAFCVNCGRKLEAKKASLKRKTGFSWQVDEKSAFAEIAQKVPRPAPKPGIGKASLVGIAVLGALVGGLAAVSVTNSSNWRFALERCHWPHQGLALYVQPPLAKVALEEEKTNQIIVGQVHADGSLKFKHIPAGRYRLFIDAPGHVSAFTFVDVEANRPTVIGFPSPVQLPVR
jgi:hypothetical protein